LNLELYCGLAGQPYLLREEKQDVMINVTTKSKKAAKILFFIFKDSFIINGFGHQLFYKYNIDFGQRQGFAGLCRLLL
jgi:hypothetical protein